MNKSDYLKDAVLNAWLRGITPTLPSSKYLALFTVSPTSAGGGTEVTGGGYSRQVVTFAAPSSGVCTTTGAVVFPTPPAAWGNNVGSVALFDALTGGNMLYFGPLSVSKAIDIGDPVFFPTGYFSIGER